IRMRTQARAGADADVPTSPADRHGAGRIREQLPSLILIAVAGGLVAAFFLALYAVKQYPMPIGWDTPRYLDQTNLVAAHGLAGVPQHLPPPIKTLPSRGGFPIVILTLSSLFHAGTFTLAAVAPPAAAVAIALAAGALVPASLRAWRAGDAFLATPSARLAGALAGGGAVAAAGIFGVLRAAPDTPKLSRGELLKKVHDDVPLYRYWLI